MKEKIVKIGGKDVPLKTSAYTPLLYANLFNSNIFAEMQEIITSAGGTGVNYCMAKQADDKIPPMEKWMDQFDVYDIQRSQAN